ncbi:MAG TPA: alpha/beta hydrolase [Polyangia bacterium]|jgi:alpha-beta hydrolase superfamily lysophospholipase|nr:alpha/beta hydrolase [Polyangia bacterium]
MGGQPSKETSLTTKDGLSLYAEWWQPDNRPAIGVAVLIHGFSAHCGNYRPVAERLAAAGIAAWLFDSRGHGRSQGRRGYVRRFSDYSDDLDLMVAAARAQWPGLPLALIGHSQGGAVALDYLTTGRGPVQAVVLATPWLALKLKVPRLKLLLSRLMGRVWPTLTMGNEIRPEEVSRNPEVLAGWKDDKLIHHAATPRWFNEVRAAQVRILAAPEKLQVPTLLLAAGEDRLVSTDTSLAYAKAVGPTIVVRAYPGLYHEIFLEPERDAVLAEIADWLTERFRA